MEAISKIKGVINGNSRFSEIVRFGIVGGIATIIQIVVYVVFVRFVHVPAVVSTLISYGISFIFNFFLSNYFTFKSSPNAKNAIGFTLSHLINMGMQTGLVAIFKGFIPAEYALLPTLAICIPINYLLVRFVLTNERFQSNSKK